jgi:monofunctional biosynthetic peptidoglycan transglycosylase
MPMTPKAAATGVRGSSRDVIAVHSVTASSAANVVAEADASVPQQPRERPAWRVGLVVRKAFGLVVRVLLVWLAVMTLFIALFRFVDPPISMLMILQRLSGTQITRQWVPLERISDNLKRAVIVSEDGRFCRHWGIDPREVAAAIERAREGMPRGASTITMQVAKNLFLWPSKSYARKALEVPLTLLIELMWSKRRILEVYLNIAEWGPGVFGAEAATRYHFDKPVARLSPREAALLAVSLPNPIRRDAGDPGRGVERLALAIQARMRADAQAAACVLGPR